MTIPHVNLATVAKLNPSTPKLDPDEEVAFVPMAAVSECGSMRIAEYKSAADLANGYSYFQSGDVLLAKITPCYENNKIAVASINRQHGFGSTEFHVIRPDLQKLDARYLAYCLRQDSVRQSGTRRMTGSGGQRRVPRNFIEELRIPLPPLDEQRRIAAILDQADALRRKRQLSLNILEELEAAAFNKLHYRSSNSLMTISLAEIAHSGQHSFGNGPFGSNLLTSELTETGVPVIYIRDIRGAEYSRVSEVFVTEEKAKELAYCSVQAEDVLIAKVGDPPGTSAVYPSGEPDAIVTQDVIRLRVDKQKVFPEYVAAFLNSSIGQSRIKGITVQATRARFALRELKQLTIELPALSQQEQFVERVRKIATIKKNQRAHLVQLNTLFASLQHRAFRGEL